MMKNIASKTLWILLSLTLLFLSCAVEKDEETAVINDKYIRAYMKKHYPGIEPNEHGIYVLEHRKTGNAAKVTDYEKCYAIVRYSIRDMDGSYIFSCYDTVARKVGTYNRTSYYGSHIWPYGSNKKAVGLEEVLEMMSEKDLISAMIPSELLNKAKDGSKIKGGDANPKIYDIQLDSVIRDVDEYEMHQMKAYAKNFESIDPISGNKAYISKFRETNDTIQDEKYVKMRYVGRLLNGFVFDSNIKDTAKKYGFYDPNNTYDLLEMRFHRDSMQMVSSNKMIVGFALTVRKMKYGEKAVSFFHSDLGYGDKGNFDSDGKIPGYSPLSFEIWLEEKPEEE